MGRIKTSYMAHRGGEEPAEDDPLLAFTPVPHKQLKKNSIGPERQRRFIAALAASGVVTDAARAIGVTMEGLYGLRNRAGAEEFRAAWDAAVDRAMARVEDAAVARAIEGTERPIVSGRQLLGWYRVHNEALVTFLLRNRRPDRYGAIPQQALKPGHPAYERIKRQVLAEDDADEAEVLASIDAFIDDMRQRRLANEGILTEWNDEGEDAQAAPPPSGDAEGEERP